MTNQNITIEHPGMPLPPSENLVGQKIVGGLNLGRLRYFQPYRFEYNQSGVLMAESVPMFEVAMLLDEDECVLYESLC